MRVLDLFWISTKIYSWSAIIHNMMDFHPPLEKNLPLDFPHQGGQVIVQLRHLRGQDDLCSEPSSHMKYFTSNSAKLILEGLKGKRTAKLNLVSISRVTWFFASSMARSWIKINSIGCSAKFYEFTWRRPWIFLTKAGLTLSSNSSERKFRKLDTFHMYLNQPAGV